MTEKDWKREIDNWETTQISMAAYCRQKNLSYWSFRIWKKKFESELSLSETSPLVKLNLPTAVHQDFTSSLEIHFGNVWIKVPDHFNEKSLQQVLTLLQKTDLQ